MGGKGRSFMEAMCPLVSTFVAMGLCFLWVLGSQNDIIQLDPRCVFFLTGTLFSNVCCKLIISQMSNTRCELFSFILAPLALATTFVLLVPGLSVRSELSVLYGLTIFVLVAHIHYGTCVVHTMCDHFNIRPFHIRHGESKTKSVTGDTEPLLAEGNLAVPNGVCAKKRL